MLMYFRQPIECNTVREVTDIAREVEFEIELVESFVSEFPILPGAIGRAETALVLKAMRTNWGRETGADLIAVLRKRQNRQSSKK